MIVVADTSPLLYLLPIVGTLAVLAKAAEAELIDLPNAVARLRQTNFRASEELFEWLLSRR